MGAKAILTPPTVNLFSSAPLLMVASSFLFASMGLCVKFASLTYGTGEVVFYRGLIGALFVWALAKMQGVALRTQVPGLHLRRSLSGVAALILWFFAIGHLPLATAITLNYMSSIWMAALLVGGAWWWGRAQADKRLVSAVVAGFAGVTLVLQPSISPDQWRGAVAGLLSGLLSAVAYLQVRSLGRAGEPELRVVFYFSLGSVTGGALLEGLGGSVHSLWQPQAGWLVATGLLATSAQIMMTRAYAIGKALANASLQYLGIGWSFLYGVFVFDEPASALALSGMAVIVVAGIAASRWSRPPPDAAADIPSPSQLTP